jgi:hypothetical protein
LEGEILVTPLSPDVAPWYRPQTSEGFPNLGFITPPPVRVTDFVERETYFSLSVGLDIGEILSRSLR